MMRGSVGIRAQCVRSGVPVSGPRAEDTRGLTLREKGMVTERELGCTM